ncbi:MAG: hypothetical protein V4437_02225 [Patescibacteria group bacterium]
MKTKIIFGSAAMLVLVAVAAISFFVLTARPVEAPVTQAVSSVATTTPTVIEALGNKYLKTRLFYCFSEGGNQCAPVNEGGLCEGLSEKSPVNEYDNHAVGIQAAWDLKDLKEQVQADEIAGGYKLYYTVYATDEYGNESVAIPRTLHSEVAHAPFNVPFSLGFIGSLRPLLYHLVIDIEPKNFPEHSYQTNTKLTIPRPETLSSNPSFCNAVTNGFGSGLGF